MGKLPDLSGTEAAPEFGQFLSDVGKFLFNINSADTKDTLAGGTMIVMELSVLAPASHAGSTLTHRINVAHPDGPTARAVEIGKGELQRICEACGLDGFPEMSEELNNKRFVAFTRDDKPYNGYRRVRLGAIEAMPDGGTSLPDVPKRNPKLEPGASAAAPDSAGLPW